MARAVLCPSGMRSEETRCWLAKEVECAWLLGERALRSLQARGIAAPASSSQMTYLEALIAERAIGRAEKDPAVALETATPGLIAQRREAPIAQIARALHLRAHEIDVWMLLAATQLDPPLQSLFNAVRTSVGSGEFDVALAAELLGIEPASKIDLLDVVDPARPLAAWRLIHIGGGDVPDVHRALRPDFDAVSLLSGRASLDPALAPHAELVTGHDVDEVRDADTAERVAQICSAVAVAGDDLDDLPWVIAWGPRGAGKRTLAAQVARAAGRPLLSVSLAGDAATLPVRLTAAKRAARVRGAVLYVGPIDPARFAGDWDTLARELCRFPGFAVVGLETAAPPTAHLPRAATEVALGWPDEQARATLWRRAVPSALCDDVDLDALARSFRLTPGEIGEIADEGVRQARLGGTRLRHATLRAGVDRRLRTDLGKIARRLSATARWEDVVLPDDAVSRLREFLARGRHADQVWARWGFGARVGYGTGMVALFSGPPGTGKTMLAGLIARELDLDLYAVDLSQVLSKWIGETEKQITSLFEAAERAHAVLLFDEADSLFAKRTEVEGASDRYGNSAVNCLLQRLEAYRGVAVLTTNKDASLDEALKRRVQLHLRLDKPDEGERARLWRSLLPGAVEVAEAVDFVGLARRYDLTGGHIKNAVVRAAFLAADERGVLTNERLHRAAMLELEDLGRVVQRPPDPHPRSTHISRVMTLTINKTAA